MALTGLAGAGDNIVAAATVSEDAYTHFKFRFPSIGIAVKFVDINDVEAVRGAIDEKTRAVYIESISSIGLEVADIEAIASLASETGVPLVV